MGMIPEENHNAQTPLLEGMRGASSMYCGVSWKPGSWIGMPGVFKTK